MTLFFYLDLFVRSMQHSGQKLIAEFGPRFKSGVTLDEYILPEPTFFNKVYIAQFKPDRLGVAIDSIVIPGSIRHLEDPVHMIA